jgi:5'-nucleotidase
MNIMKKGNTMHILVTNDDGIRAPGLLALAESLKNLGKVSVMAPDRNWSASGHGRTLEHPLRAKESLMGEGIQAWAIDGSPADCVALGLNGFLNEKVDLVVSGINSSSNLGQDVFYSGTVSAAMEAAIWGVPGIAVSLCTPDNLNGPADYGIAAEAALQVARTAASNQLKPGLVLNVNIPYLPEGHLSGIQVTRQGLRVYHDHVESRSDPRGKPYYWVIGESPTSIPEPGTDVGAVAEGYVSVTPLHLDMTAYQCLPELSAQLSFPCEQMFVMPQATLSVKVR